METKIAKNIALVRIPIKAGTSEYFFPQNVDWAGEMIDRIAVCAPANACLDPIDGQTPVMTRADVDALFFNLFRADGTELYHDISVEQILHTNNNGLEINEVLALENCKMYFNTAPAADATLLIYVYYGTKTKDDYDYPQHSVTITFPLTAGQEISIKELITTYISAIPDTVKGIMFWDAENNPAYITLRDSALTYTLQNIHCEMARNGMVGTGAEGTQANILLFDNININMHYSYIRNAVAASTTQKITFLY